MSKQSKMDIVVDLTRRAAISPFVYGVNFPDWNGFQFSITVARQGGNRMTAYNWENNASNAGSDYQHQNDSFVSASDVPGEAVTRFLNEAKRGRADAAIVTVPMIGYVAADKRGGGDVNQTPNYLSTRFKKSLPGKGGPFSPTPDTRDDSVFQDEFVAFLEKSRGSLPVWYALDNEPDLWQNTHARLVSKNPTYAEIIGTSVAYAAAIKKVAPKSLILGPVNYGWQGFRRFQSASDANNRDFLDVYLAAMRDAGKARGVRLLDLMDVHFYPEARGGGSRITEDKPGTEAARIQAPRSLWDPTYVEESWIANSLGNKPIALLPGLQKQIARHYPGTKLALSEYHYGGRTDISGALAQADVLGIYGRFGVHTACVWGMGARDIATLAAFRAFLNYDDRGARFGDIGLGVAGETPAENSVYASTSEKSPNAFTIVAINKTETARPLTLKIAGKKLAAATGYRVDATMLGKPARVQPTLIRDNTLIATLPPKSIVTFEVKG